jgi:hypothetical protein
MVGCALCIQRMLDFPLDLSLLLPGRIYSQKSFASNVPNEAIVKGVDQVASKQCAQVRKVTITLFDLYDANNLIHNENCIICNVFHKLTC